MDIQKIIEDVIAKIKADPEILKLFTTDPIAAVKKLVNIDLDMSQLNEIVDGVKSKVDLSSLGDIGDVVEAAKDVDAGASYLSIMENNLSVLQKALR